jgi:transposase
MFPTSILPNEQLLGYEATRQIGSCFHLTLTSKQTAPPCPLCSTPSRRVHSRYTRSVADLSVAGYRVMLELQVKKFFKASPDHCERLPEVVQPYGRRSIRLVETLKHLGLLVSAEVSRRIADKFGIRASPDSFLRAARGFDAPSDEVVVRQVGIDDFAKRKGHTYGTIIVDLERGCPVELLPDRETSTLVITRAKP